MIILNSNEMQDVENRAFALGVNKLDLMRTAGQKCAEEIIKIYELETKKTKVVVACGNGKNGGDGFVIAKILKEADCDVKILLADREPTEGDCRAVFEEAKSALVEICSLSVENSLLANADLIVDCLFGIGFHGAVAEPFSAVIEEINNSGAEVVSVDVPSGTNATTGEISGIAVKADCTLAISSLKYSHVLPPSNQYCGKIKVVNIGIDKMLFNIIPFVANTIERKDIAKNFVKRSTNSNKGDYGKILSVCGSYRMPGAAIISAKSAVRSGAGLVTVAFPKSAYPAIAGNLTEAVFLPLPETEDGTVNATAKPILFDSIEKATTMLVGCGLGTGENVEQIVEFLLEKTNCPIVLDADGINALGHCINLLRERKAPVVLTPHPGEMARLVGDTVGFVQSHRIDLAKTFAESLGAIVVLKGANTIVTDGKAVFINRTGNPGMAKGGTGDMLAGMIASFIAQGMSPMEASKSAVFIHGECGNICQRELSQRGMTVSDMIELLPALLSKYE